MHGGSFKPNPRDWLIVLNASFLFERLVSLADREDHVAGHLAPQGSGRAQMAIGALMERRSIPTTMFLDNRHEGITRRGVRALKSLQHWSIFIGHD